MERNDFCKPLQDFNNWKGQPSLYDWYRAKQIYHCSDKKCDECKKQHGININELPKIPY